MLKQLVLTLMVLTTAAGCSESRVRISPEHPLVTMRLDRDICGNGNCTIEIRRKALDRIEHYLASRDQWQRGASEAILDEPWFLVDAEGRCSSLEEYTRGRGMEPASQLGMFLLQLQLRGLKPRVERVMLDDHERMEVSFSGAARVTLSRQADCSEFLAQEPLPAPPVSAAGQ